MATIPSEKLRELALSTNQSINQAIGKYNKHRL